MSKFITIFDDLLWSPIPMLSKVPLFGWLSPLAVLLVGTGIWFTFKTRFIQVRGFNKGMRNVFGGLIKKSEKADHSGMTPFQAFCTAIAAQVGTGNVVGASTAIAVGGPGAIFWMWIAAFFGMATIFVEATLAQKFKVVGADGQITGGPVYYITSAFKNGFGKFLAVFFALLIIISLGFMGCAVQSNGIADAWKTVFVDSFGISIENAGMIIIVIGIILAAVAFLIFVGGVSSIAAFTERIVPIMAIIYIVGSLIVIVVNYRFIPDIFRLIFAGAFNGQAIAGGATGWVIKNALGKGVARGLFSNEAGMGSTPHAHAVAKVDHPADQGFTAMIGVFTDTFIILDLTAFVVIGSYIAKGLDAGDLLFTEGQLSLTGAALAQAGFRTVFGSFGNIFIAITLTFFAFSTVIGWYFFGEANWKYLFKGKATKLYAVIVCICIFFGSLVVKLGANANDIWNLQDALNGLMVIPNLIGILALTGVAVSLLNENTDKYGLK